MSATAKWDGANGIARETVTPASKAMVGEVFLRGRRPSDHAFACDDCGAPNAEWISDPTEWQRRVIAYCAAYVESHRG